MIFNCFYLLSPWSSIVFVCFSKVFPKGEYANLACSITLLCSISSFVRYSYLLILLDYNADIFAASLLISYCNFSYLIFSSIVMISFYILYKRFFLKHEQLSDGLSICWSSHFFQNFIIKYSIEFSLRFFGTEK